MSIEVKSIIRNFIQENFLIGRSKNQFDDDTSFLDTGIIDSTGMLELIAFLEEEFSIEILDEELVPENLDSVNRVVTFVGRKKEE